MNRRLWVRAGALGLVAAGFLAGGKPTEAAPDLSETCDGMLEDDLSLAPGKARETSDAYEVLPDVSLPTKVEERIRAVAEKYRKSTGKSITVTSGTRSAASQADVVYDKIAAGDDVVKLYKNKTAVLELKRIFDDGKAAKKDRSTIVDEMAAAIRAQIKRGIFISAHLRAGAADIRSTDMSAADKRRFIEASEVGGVSVMLEATPPHFHLQLQ